MEVPAEIIVFQPSYRIARVLKFDDDIDDDLGNEQNKTFKSKPETSIVLPVETKTPEPKPPKVVTPAPPGSPSLTTSGDEGFKLTPPNFNAKLEAALAFKEWPKKGKISLVDNRVRSLPHLEICPRKSSKKTCHCFELAYGATTSFQDDIRAMYCKVIELSDRDEGNWLLMSYMVPRVNSKGEKTFAFKIPGFIDDGRVRIFYVCPPQFCKLFGLSTKRFYKLLKRRKDVLEDGAPALYYQWTEKEDAYILGDVTYKAFRSEYWIEDMLKHGCWKVGDNFDCW